jgi:hypothetical protein
MIVETKTRNVSKKQKGSKRQEIIRAIQTSLKLMLENKQSSPVQAVVMFATNFRVFPNKKTVEFYVPDIATKEILKRLKMERQVTFDTPSYGEQTLKVRIVIRSFKKK